MRLSRSAVGLLVTAGLALGTLAATTAPAAAADGDQCTRVAQQANGNVGILNGINVYLPDGSSRGGWFDDWNLFGISGSRYSDGDRSVNCGDGGFTRQRPQRHHRNIAPAADVAPAGYGYGGR